MRKLTYILALLIVILVSGSLKAQISIAPSFVFIDQNSGVGNVFVSNNSDKAYEVGINFAFGYPGSNPEGDLIMIYNDSTAYDQYALDPIVRAFPRTFILKGHEQRTVRLQVIPKQKKVDGFYFTRMKVMAKPQTADLTEAQSEGIGTKINFNFEQITAVFYHKGIVSTGVTVKDINVAQKDGKLVLLPHLVRTGNAPFLGSMFAKLKDANGKIVAESQSTTTVYFDEIRRLELKLDNVAPGTYTLVMNFETHRNDMLSGDLIQAPATIQEKKIEIK
jgi:hypothetical protein